MKLFLTIISSLVALIAGDVAHLGRTYLPPSRTVAAFNSGQGFSNENNFSERLTQFQVVPSQSFALPAAPAQLFTSSSSFNAGYRAPARFVAQNFAAQAPAAFPTQNFAAPSTFATQRFNSARLVQPSRQYLSPEVETFEPIVQRTYSAPAITYSQPAAYTTGSSSAAFTNGLDTKYSSDGGYVY